MLYNLMHPTDIMNRFTDTEYGYLRINSSIGRPYGGVAPLTEVSRPYVLRISTFLRSNFPAYYGVQPPLSKLALQFDTASRLTRKPHLQG